VKIDLGSQQNGQALKRASGNRKSTTERAGNARKEACRQTLMVLQHENVLSEASEF
jgi:hypothetical protein